VLNLSETDTVMETRKRTAGQGLDVAIQALGTERGTI
jgi:hypothetical protein